ncbi:MAG: hypothetical protein ABI556_16005 [Gemmatimonadales bacterium]
MRTFSTFAAFATFAAVSGCATDSITNVDDLQMRGEVVRASTSVERPWKGVCNVIPVFTSETTVVYTGTCQLAHLGRVAVSADQIITPGPDGIDYTNTGVYTAANGDVMRTTQVGFATPTATGLAFTGIETAVGGTGRFAGASGSAMITGSVTVTSPTLAAGQFSISGRLEY